MDAVEDLTAQIARVEDGWVKHTPRKDQEACLAYWSEGVEMLSLQDPAMNLVKEILAELYPGSGVDNISLFNDSPDRTKEDVLKVLRTALAIALDE